MLWVAALLSIIIWILGWSSGFLGPVIHVFLLLALLAILSQFVLRSHRDAPCPGGEPDQRAGKIRADGAVDQPIDVAQSR